MEGQTEPLTVNTGGIYDDTANKQPNVPHRCLYLVSLCSRCVCAGSRHYY